MYKRLGFSNWASSLAVEYWRSLETVTLVPYYTRYLRANGRPITEEVYPYDSYVDWYSDILILDELAMTIEITDDLFVDGF